MESSIKESSSIKILIDEAKTLMIRIYTLIFEAEYDSLYITALDVVNDAEVAKNILDESLNETILAILESGFKLFQPDEIKNSFKLRINECCQKYISKLDAEREFQIIHRQTLHHDNSRDEDIRKAALEAFDKLSPARKRILYDTLQSGSPKTVAEKNNIKIESVFKMNWKTREMLKKMLCNKI